MRTDEDTCAVAPLRLRVAPNLSLQKLRPLLAGGGMRALNRLLSPLLAFFNSLEAHTFDFETLSLITEKMSFSRDCILVLFEAITF